MSGSLSGLRICAFCEIYGWFSLFYSRGFASFAGCEVFGDGGGFAARMGRLRRAIPTLGFRVALTRRGADGLPHWLSWVRLYQAAV